MAAGDYILRKVGWALLTVVFVAVLNFFLFRVLPGDPTTTLARDPRLSPEQAQAMLTRMGLDKPLFLNLNGNLFDSQFFIYFGNLLHGELGTSFLYQRPVAELLRERLASTVTLVMGAQLLSIVLGLALGLAAAWRRGTALDIAAIVFSLFTWALPTFFLGIILLILGSTYFGLPIGGSGTPGASFDTVWERASDLARHLVLPTITYTVVLLGEYTLIMRSSLLEVLGEDYVLTAKAKGLRESEVMRKHALRNALLPMVTLFALNLGLTVAGALQVETIFSWPGLGRAIFDAVKSKDYPMLQGAFLLIAVSVVLANLLAELLYAYLDPRVRTS